MDRFIIFVHSLVINVKHFNYYSTPFQGADCLVCSKLHVMNIIELHDNPKISRSMLLIAAKNNPDAVLRLAKYLRLYFTTDSIKKIAKFIDCYINE